MNTKNNGVGAVLNQLLDVSCVQAIHTLDEIDEMIELAIEYEVKCVFTLPCFTSYVSEKLRGNPQIKIGGTVGFPSGGETTAMKVFQAKELINLGCDELDMVMNLTAFNSGMYDNVSKDIKKVVKAAGDVPVKVICEIPSLQDEQIRTAVDICIDSGAAFVKSGTGWQEKKTEVRHIEAVSKYTNNRIKIKAAGGIRNMETIEAMYEHGCTRFGVNINTARNLLSSI